ncbi:Endoribonuclease [Aphelenchoides fujianensis]|nr:Endoribonuclease [Aphelenchoides fujianensis]
MDDLRQLAIEMRQKDDEKPEFCDFLLDYQEQYKKDTESVQGKLYKEVVSKALLKPSFSKLLALRPFFNPRAGVMELQSPEKDNKINEFLATVWSSRPFQLVLAYLTKKQHPWTVDEKTFKEAIRHIWFGVYSRADRKLGSSGFEHVFLGEIVEKKMEVGGMHNWAIVHTHEVNKTDPLQYRGWIVKRADVIASGNFMWGRYEKKIGGFFLSTSPSFDFALLTLCFLTNRDDNRFQISVDGCEVEVQAYDLIQNTRAFIGTVYPETGKKSSTCDSEYKKRAKCCPNFQKDQLKKQKTV